MKKIVKIAAMGDIHVRDKSGMYEQLFEQISKEANILVLAGDLTDRGLVSEAELLAKELKSCSIPVVAVLGNHDYEAGLQEEITNILKNENVSVLEGESVVVQEVGFAGVKGFCGGFDNNMLTPWGEQSIKSFVKEAVDDSLKLENALMRLSTEAETVKQVVVMHYAPIKETVIGEPPEIFPFLGCSRFANVINRFKVNYVFHGHAHHGAYEGKTSQGIQVYNVASVVLQKHSPDKPYAIITL